MNCLTAIQQGLLFFIDITKRHPGFFVGFEKQPSLCDEFKQLVEEGYMAEEPFESTCFPEIKWRVIALEKGKDAVSGCDIVSVVLDMCEDDWVWDLVSDLVEEMSEGELVPFLVHRHSFVRGWAIKRLGKLKKR